MDLTLTLPPALAAVADTMRGFPAPWCVAGGWAIDLSLGRRTREHADVDVALFREDQLTLRRWLAGWSFRKAVNGALVEWADGEWLSLPVHEIHAVPDDGGAAMEFLLNEHDGERWLFRRDPSVRCPVRDVIGPSPSGLPVLCPAAVLLYKARAPREADELDFSAVLGHLAPKRRKWLRAALERVHPGHPWLARLRP